MLLWISEQLVQLYSGFNVFQYITLRAILSILTALSLSLLIGPYLIRHLSERQIGQSIRHDGPQSHLSKAGTPTMGGALILVSIGVTTILWSNLSNRYIWVVLLVTASFGLVGWFDDYLKVIARNSKGLSAKAKYFWQSAIAFCTIAFLLYSSHPNDVTTLVIPFFKYVVTISPWVFALLAYFVIVGTSNAVNLTDGLDGLAIMPTVLIAGALGIFVYAAGNFNFATYLGIPYISGAGEIIVFCGAIVGSGLGFLWFNTYPAQVFMGDVGALALGAALGIVAVIARQELVLFIMGGVFVVETISVILQVISFRLTGRRIFHMAPLHHHFELKGWPEPRVIVRFWIITVVLVLIGLATLKVR